ncbi:putative AMP-dependent synthetase and ligase [Pseudomonas sp. M47T1]|uniref:AMP-binding protein n=1 Tax=Pseudomonas sp. M47T1 TaxID=1179778 RepID=UPI00026075D0|nr:AMP-binding protein [Pseudomonas sp. M47T1]EIK95780.1 putative AMP-dependent synthetase and ligase [Pseudomonas sp. M47T1]
MNAITHSEPEHLQAAGWSAGDQDTINAVLRRAVSAYGDRIFLDFLGEQYSFRDIDRHACQVANGLRALGVSKGQTVVTILDNCAEAIIVLFAITKLGAVSVPVNTAYKGEFLRHQVADSGAAVVIAQSDYAERVAAIASGIPAVSTVVYRGATPDLGAAAERQWQVIEWPALYSDDTSDPAVDIAPSDLAMLIYTGGTTGPSKGCMVNHNYTCNLGRQMLEVSGRDHTSVTWTPLPMFHFNAVGATLMSNLMVGAKVALYTRFSVSNFWPEIERTGANEVMLLASMFPLLVQAADNDAMQRCHGQIVNVIGAPFPPDIQAQWKARFGVKRTIISGFGLTECAMVTVQPLDVPAAPGSSGMRHADFDVRIVDEHDVEVPVGSPGEIIVRPSKPNVMFDGYWQRPADTLKLLRNQWFHTGDIGRFDEQGYFYFVDRKKDYLRRRGENISSFEVEAAFRQRPEIEDIAAHAVRSDLGEDELKVTIVLRAGHSLEAEPLFLWSVDHLPYFAVPRYIEFRREVPRSPVGRILKYQLRDEGVTAATWDQEQAGIKISKR